MGRMTYSNCERERPILKGTGKPIPSGEGDLTTTLREQPSMISTYESFATWLRARFGDSERGASLVEYALLVALIAVVCIAAVRLLGEKADSTFDSTNSGLTSATAGTP